MECKRCINSLPTLIGCRKRRVDMCWPEDYECLMKEIEFPDADGCEWHLEIDASKYEKL